jgi:serine protease inhibitor
MFDNYETSNALGNMSQRKESVHFSKRVRQNSRSKELSENIKTNMNRRHHETDVDRRIMERDIIFNQNSRQEDLDKLRKNDKFSNKFSKPGSKTGEITGNFYEVSELEQGMPMRHLNEKENVANDLSMNNRIVANEMYNPQLDFDLYDVDPSIEIEYNDPNDLTANLSSNNLQYSPLDKNENTKILTKGDSNNLVNPLLIYKTCSNGFSLYITTMFRGIFKQTATVDHITLSPISILNSLTMLYRGAKGGTEKELYSHLFYKHRELIYSGASDVLKEISKCDNISHFNMILFPSTNYVNKAYQQFMSAFGVVANINNLNYKREAQRINYLSSKNTNGVFNNIIRINDVKNITDKDGGCMVISLFHIKVEWTYPFVKTHTIPKLFMGKNKQKMVEMMHLFGKKIRYVEDSRCQLLELDLRNKNLSMGFLLYKNNRIPRIEELELTEYISNLNNEYIGIIQIPKFTHKGKYKLNDAFHTMGIKQMFNKASFPDITPDSNLRVNNIMHQSIISVDEGSDKLHAGNMADRHNSQNKSFIANHSFMYYIRYKPMNLLLMTGLFM